MKNNNNIPPRLATRVLTWLLKNDLAEEVLGDLNEQFHTAVHKKSLRSAKRNYWYQVFNYLRPFALKNTGDSFVFNAMIIIGIVSRIDSILIYSIIKSWDHDIPSFYHAIQLRQNRIIKRHKLFNG